ncbi:MAG: glycoside hydrolase family 11 protein [Deltaproteobacteria bacterium]|nr:glycoside hydrolase family 11 protein [Deltaproteobacteria bacterium]
MVFDCTAPARNACSNLTGLHCGLTYEIWTGSTREGQVAQTGCMTNTFYGFSAEWGLAQMNYLARKGVRPGSSNLVVRYIADYNPVGPSHLGVYGWLTDPLVEFYVLDSWGSWRPPGTSILGTVTTDGGTYDIFKTQRVDQFSIIAGKSTFWQYWSVRQEKRTRGTITVAPHFEAWTELGLEMGNFYEVSLLVEAYDGSGTADVQVSFE